MNDRIFCYKLQKGMWGQELLDDIESVFRDHKGGLVLQRSVAPLEAERKYVFASSRALVRITAQNTMRYYKDRRRMIAAYVCTSSSERSDETDDLERALERLEEGYPLSTGFKTHMRAWRAHCERVKHSSDPHDYTDCDAYRRIVDMGESALPGIAEELGSGDPCFAISGLTQAITDILGDAFHVPPALAGKVEAIRQYSLGWLNRYLDKRAT